MINAYYFNDNDLDELIKAAKVSFSSEEKALVVAMHQYVQTEYNLAFKEYLAEAELTCADIKTAMQDIETTVDAIAFVDASLEQFYAHQQRAYAALLSGQRKI